METLDTTVHQPADGSAAVAQGDGLKGTLGCLVRWNGTTYILGSAHIMTAGGASMGGAALLQPPANCTGARQVGSIFASAPLAKHDGDTPAGDAVVNRIDAALATAIAGQVSAKIGVLQYPAGFRTDPLGKGDYVQICGAASGLVGGSVKDPDHRISIRYGLLYADFEGLVQCTSYSKDGDSGATVLDGDNQVVGVHVAGGDGSSYFCPIAAVLAQWPGLELITSDET